MVANILGSPSTTVNNTFKIFPAQPNDANDIFAMKREAFTNDYLMYTIYQTPQSVRHLRALLSQGSEESGRSIFVIRKKVGISAYYMALTQEEQFFLSYIAVKKAYRSQGLGSALLEHYQERGKALGYDKFALDVFENNPRAKDWYLNRGYRFQSESFLAQISLAGWGHRGFTGKELPVDHGEWKRARTEEEVNGFSKIDCCIEDHRLCIGLIGGRFYKLINFENLCLTDAVLSAVQHFSGRDALIVSGLKEVPKDWPLLSVVRVLRLEKRL